MRPNLSEDLFDFTVTASLEFGVPASIFVPPGKILFEALPVPIFELVKKVTQSQFRKLQLLQLQILFVGKSLDQKAKI